MAQVSTEIDIYKPVGNANTVKRMLNANAERLLQVLPAGLTPERMIRTALLAFSKTPKLLQCTGITILESIINSAVLGLECGGPLGHAYLVPFANTCQLIPGYRGLILLAYQSGLVKSIRAGVVYKDELFEYVEGSQPLLRHVPNIDDERKDSEIRGAWMSCELTTGGIHFDFLSKHRIEKAKAVSKSARNADSPWQKWYSEMAIKTVLKHGLKLVPMSAEKLSRAIELDDADIDPSVDPNGATARKSLNASLNLESAEPTAAPQSDADAKRAAAMDDAYATDIPTALANLFNFAKGKNAKLTRNEFDETMAKCGKIWNCGMHEFTVDDFVNLHNAIASDLFGWDTGEIYAAAGE